MSTHDAAVFVPVAPSPMADAAARARGRGRPLVRVCAAFGLCGVLRFSTLLHPAPVARLLGMLAVTTGLLAAGHRLAGRPARLTAAGVAALLGLLPLAGVPVAWLVHVRIAVTANGLADGGGSLPAALVPYSGGDRWVGTVILLGAGLLLFAAAAALAATTRVPSDGRRALAAIPLIALAAVPCALLRPRLPYVQGLILFGLLTAFVWGERLRRGDAALAGALATVAGFGAMITAPALDRRGPWLDYQALTGQLAPSPPAAFDWAQRYGRLDWPRHGRAVLEVEARRGDYWKAENLDLFDGRRWVGAALRRPEPERPPDPAPGLENWTQSPRVRLVAMRSHEVIAAGTGLGVEHLRAPVRAGNSRGTWTVAGALGPGDGYTVRVLSPRPSPGQLRAAGTSYPGFLLPGYLTLVIPEPGAVASGHVAFPARAPAIPVSFPPYGSTPFEADAGHPLAALEHSPYAGVYALAMRLRRGAATPFDYLSAVERYLGRGFVYAETPSSGEYPLVTFLLASRRGYCQQFAGAMALLLRMGGVPARVAAGFTTGSYDDARHAWVVSDQDAHAWVEAWFPHYGWVRFDPTTAGDPALGAHPATPIRRLAGGGSTAGPTPHGLAEPALRPAAAPVPRPRGLGGAPSPLLLVALGLGGVLVGWAAGGLVRLSPPSPDELLDELERALARTGRPPSPATTLAALERRFHSSPAAGGYIRAVRLARFADATAAPSADQRRALRRELGEGLGIGGRLRSLQALPPRLTVAASAWVPPRWGIH